MNINQILSIIFTALGIFCLFRPMLFIYLFLAITTLWYAPLAFGDLNKIIIFKSGFITVYILDYLIVLMLLFFLKSSFHNWLALKNILKSPITKSIIIFFLWKLFIGALSYNKGFLLQNILRQISLEGLLFISILIPLIDDAENKEKGVFTFSIFAAILIISFGFLKYFVFHEINLTSSGTQRTLPANANLILFFSLCYVVLCDDFKQQNRLLSLLFVILIPVGIHFSGFRTGWIVFLFIMAMWFVQLKNKLELVWFPLLSFSSIFFLIFLCSFAPPKSGTFVGDFLVRASDIFNLTNRTTEERLSKWEYAINIVEKRPFLGLARFHVFTMHIENDNKNLAYMFPELNRATHNLIASQALHEGLIGVFMLICFFAVVFIEHMRTPPAVKENIFFMMTFIISIIIYSMFETGFNNHQGKILFAIMLGFVNNRLINAQI